MTFPKLMADYNAYVQGEHPNYFMGGYKLGQIYKMVMDQNINN
jgi:hypothetical protein